MDSLCLFDEDTLITGSSDGGVRVVSILPNKLLAYLGLHAQDDTGFDLPVERLALSGDRRMLATTAHDNCVQLWDLKMLHDDASSSSGAPRVRVGRWACASHCCTCGGALLSRGIDCRRAVTA